MKARLEREEGRKGERGREGEKGRKQRRECQAGPSIIIFDGLADQDKGCCHSGIETSFDT